MQGTPHRLSGKFSTATVFCDFDGPIVDVSTRYYSTYRLALANLQKDFGSSEIAALTPLSQEEFWQMKRNRMPDIEIAGKSGLPPAVIDSFLGQVSEIVNHSDLLYQDKIQPGVSWALNLLSSKGAQLILVTLRDRDQAQGILEEAGLLHLFTGIFGTTAQAAAAYVNSIEHKTRLLRSAVAAHWPLEIRDRQPAWMIGDTEADIWAGRNLGINTIALTCGIRSREYLQQQSPSFILDDLISASSYLLRECGDRVPCHS
jgi:phosphoglycolate phosphatase